TATQPVPPPCPARRPVRDLAHARPRRARDAECMGVVRRTRRSMPDMSYPERIVPDDEPPGIVALHLKRYLFAQPYCTRNVVLDAACGTGYGSAELARVATRVVGVDVDEQAIEYARSRYVADNVEFEAMDVAALDFDDASFDVVVAFEAIEHV